MSTGRPADSPRTVEVPSSVLVIGFALTGRSVARILGTRGASVVAVDDAVRPGALEAAAVLGVDLVEAPARDELARLAEAAELVVLSPGVGPAHPIFSLAPPSSIVSEIELAYRLTTTPIVAVTGTNGKTTVTALVAAMLAASGLEARALGNIGRPLIEVLDDEETEVAVVEVSSFQLAHTERFRPGVGTWLNLAEDHLDWHDSIEDYAASKARIWARQGPGDVAVANLADPTVLAASRAVRGRVVTFGPAGADYRVDGERLVGPDGELARLSDLSRRFPHDVANALGALATAMEAGAAPAGALEALREQVIPPHRVALVGEVGGVRYYDDSKATTPSAVVAALGGFESVVLIAGGRNKGLDLSAIRAEVEHGPVSLRGVVAIGEASAAIREAFCSRWPVEVAESMDDAVEAATRLAAPGDVVLLSPGCASFDWYSSYAARGDDFIRAVQRLAGASAGPVAR